MAEINLLYISPEFPPNYRNFPIQLKKAGVNVWAIGEADFGVLPEQVQASIKWYVQTNLNSTNEVKAVVTHLINDHTMPQTGKGFDVVVSHNEHWLRLESFINDTFKIDGINSRTIDRIKKKSEMKKAFISKKIKVAEGRLVKDLEDALALAKQISYPVILKPDEGVGATRMFRVDNAKQLKEVWPQLSGDYLMEDFIDADIVTYDGLVDWDGKVLFDNSLIYDCGVMENVQKGRDQFFYTTREIPKELKDLGKKLIKAFGLRRQFFHFEFFNLGQEYVPIEINARPPGGNIIDMMNYSTDGDLYAAYAGMIAGKEPTLCNKKKYFCAYIGRKDKTYKHGHEEILSSYGDNLSSHFTNPELFWVAMGKYIYIMRAETEEKLFEIKDFILAV